ncbi:MAG: hypothetical protein M1374_06930 [Firmicutes bacterium]|jgi:hypothetical protein|nr:hypothetical protein [Bacillota bacterium]
MTSKATYEIEGGVASYRATTSVAAYDNRITCVTLFHSPSEWIGVDIEAGAFLRNSRHLRFSEVPTTKPLSTKKRKDRKASKAGETQHVAAIKQFSIVVLHNTSKPFAIDPSRPESIGALDSISLIGQLTYKKIKQLLRTMELKAPSSGKILGNFGPSVAFMDLEATEPSVALLNITKSQMEITDSEDKGVVCIFEWGNTIQVLPLADAKCRKLLSASEKQVLSKKELGKLLGHKITHVLVGLYQVQNGHVPKVAMGLVGPMKQKTP